MYKIINSFYATTYDKPNFSSSKVASQAFFWEKVLVLKQEKNWSFICQNDKYKSWINNFYLVEDLNFDMECKFIMVKNKFLKISQTKEENIEIVNYLSYGTKIPFFEKKKYSKDPMMNRFHISGKDVKYEIVNNQFNLLENFQFNIELRGKIVIAAYKMLGTSYLWGGKTAFGFDCSGFVQTIYNTELGLLLPRDSSDQFNFVKKVVKDELEIADLVFFKEKGIVVHVGIYIGNDKIIHCSGKVKIDSIDKKNKDSHEIFNGLEIVYGKI